MSRGSRSVLISLLALVVCSCSGDDPPTNPGPGGPTGPGTANITPDAGGIIAVTTAEGVSVTTTFPPGAVGIPTQVTITPLSPVNGDWVTLTFDPAGLVLFEPASVVMTVPAGLPREEQNLYWGDLADPALLPTVPDAAARTVTTGIRSFGLPLEERVLSDVPPGTQPLASPQQNTPGNQMGGQQFTCQQMLAQAQADFNRLISQQNYKAAIRAALTTAANLQRATCPGVQDWKDMAAQVACDRLEAVLDSAAATSITGHGQFEKTGEKIMGWAAQVAQLGGPGCPAEARVITVLDAEITDFLAFYNPRLNGLTANDSQTFNTLRLEAAHVWHLRTDAFSLGLSAAALLIQSKALYPTFDRMREVAYTLGRENGWHYVISRLTSVGLFSGRDIIGVPAPRRCDDTYSPPRCTSTTQYARYTDDDIHDDLQYAGTDIVVETVTTSDSVLAFGLAGGGDTPDVRVDRLRLDCPTRGTLRIRGEIAAMTCWNDIEADNEVIIALNQVDARTLNRSSGQSDYLTSPAEIDLLSTAQASGFTPTEGVITELTVRRKRTQCDDDLWGDPEYTLLTVDLVWKNPTLDVDITFPSQVEPGQPTPVDIRVGVVDQYGRKAFFKEIDVDLSVVGGTPASTGGQTDSLGYFRTTITPIAPSSGALAQGSSAMPVAPAADVTVNATASSVEGVTAQESATAIISGPRAKFTSAEHIVSAGAGAALGAAPCETGPECRNTEPFEERSSDWSFGGSGDATASCGGATAQASASLSCMTNADDTGVFTTLSVNTVTSASATSDSRYYSWACACDGLTPPWAISVLQFDVLEGSLDYVFSGNGSASMNGAAELTRARLVKLSPVDVIHDEIFQNGDSGSWSESGVLGPGQYQIDIQSGVSVSVGCGQSENGSAGGNLSLTLSQQ